MIERFKIYKWSKLQNWKEMKSLKIDIELLERRLNIDVVEM